MPTTRSPRSRRLVVVVSAVFLGLLGPLVGATSTASALPLDASPFDVSPVTVRPDVRPDTGRPDAGRPDTGRPDVGSVDDEGVAPVLILPTDVTFVVGRPGDPYTVEANGDPVPTVSADGLPPGLRLTTYDDGSAVLHGTATGPAGVTTVEVRAANTEAVSYQSLTVVVQQQPAFVDRRRLVFSAGVFTNVTISTSGFPAPGIGLDGDLPTGLMLIDRGDGTGTISGTPLGGPESVPVTLTAVNEVSDVSWTTTVEVVSALDSSRHPSDVPLPDGPTR